MYENRFIYRYILIFIVKVENLILLYNELKRILVTKSSTSKRTRTPSRNDDNN